MPCPKKTKSRKDEDFNKKTFNIFNLIYILSVKSAKESNAFYWKRLSSSGKRLKKRIGENALG